MTEPYRPPLLIVADSPEALTDLCGISLLERMRRIALQLGFREAMILSNSVKAVASHVANESWHRTDVLLTFRERTGAKVTVGDILDCLAALRVAADGRILIVFAGFYCDERLLRSLAAPIDYCAAFGKFRWPFVPAFVCGSALERMAFAEKSRWHTRGRDYFGYDGASHRARRRCSTARIHSKHAQECAAGLLSSPLA